MKIIIAGGRDFDDYQYLERAVDFCFQNLNKSDIEIVSGRAKGADLLGERYAAEYKYTIKPFPADWNKYGKGAGYRRNSMMGNYADALIAFWDGKSSGTMHMINIAKKKGLQVKIFKYIPKSKTEYKVRGI